MTRIKFLFAAVTVAAIVALVAGAPVAQAQTSCGTGCSVHFVGAGSSAQFQMAAIAADQAAISANSAKYSNANTVYHWTKKFKASTGDGAYLSDNRNTAIVNQTGNIWVVWIQTSGGAITDVWLDVSVDSTVGNRCALAYETNGLGCQVQITSTSTATPDNIVAKNLYPDGNADANMNLNLWNAVNTSISGGQHVNVGLTDIRPEDAEYATKRLISTTRNTSLSELGDETAANIGGDIVSNQGTNAFAQPVGFSLPGEKDPFNTHLTVPTTFVTYPVGAAPVIFIENNGGAAGFPLNLISGVTPDIHVTGQSYSLANLWDGSTSCDTSNKAFSGGTVATTALTVFLREPLSGTMNTTEFSVFRSDGNSDDSQEGNASFNGGVPMNFTGGATGSGTGCTGNGLRSRAIGTGEVVGATSGGTGNAAYGVLGTPNSIGYIFSGWSNNSKFGSSSTPTDYQYLTLDHVDPIFAAPTAYSTCQGGTAPNNDGAVCGTLESCTATGTGVAGSCTSGGNTNQVVPYCGSSVCTSDLWDAYTDSWTGYTVPAGMTYPNIRNGMYKAWSIYRWIAIPNSDPYGPALVAQEAQNYVDGDVADFVPFSACLPGQAQNCFPANGGAGPVDGLSVFRSHFNPSGATFTCPTSTKPSNGAPNTTQVVASEPATGANTLGGGSECGGDVGGLINAGLQAAWGINSPSVSYVTWTTTQTKGKGYKLTHKNGDAFSATNPANGSNVTLVCDDGNDVETVTNTTVVNSSGTIYVGSPNPGNVDTIACKLVDGNIAHAAASAATAGTGDDSSTDHSKHQ